MAQNQPNVSNSPKSVSVSNLDANTLRQMLKDFITPIKQDTNIIKQEVGTIDHNIDDILNAIKDSHKFLTTELEKNIQSGVKKGIEETDLIPKLTRIENLLTNQSGNLQVAAQQVNTSVPKSQSVNLSTSGIQQVLQQGLSDIQNAISQLKTIPQTGNRSSTVASDPINIPGLRGFGPGLDIGELLELGSLYTSGNIARNALEVQRVTQKTGTAMAGMVNNGRLISSQLRERVKLVVTQSQGMVDVVQAAEAQNTLFEQGVSNLSKQADLLKVAAISSEEMNMEFSSIVDLAGDTAFNLRLSGKQVFSIVRGASGISKQFGLSAKHVIQIQEGSKEIFENMRKVAGASARAVNEVTKLLSALEKQRGASEFASEITKAFSGGFESWINGVENLGVAGARMMSQLQSLGVSTADIIQGRVEPEKINQAMQSVLQNIYNEALASGESADIIVSSLTGGAVKGLAEIENTLIAFNKKMKVSGREAVGEIQRLENEIATATNPNKVIEFEGKIKQLRDSLTNDLSSSFSDLESGFQRTLDLIQLDKERGEIITSSEIANKLTQKLQQQRDQLKNQIEIATKAGIEIEGINSDTIKNLEHKLTQVALGTLSTQDLMGDLSTILTSTQKQSEQIAKEQSKLSIKNALDQIEAGQNLAERDLLGLQLFALDTVTGILQNIFRVLTYIAFGHSLWTIGANLKTAFSTIFGMLSSLPASIAGVFVAKQSTQTAAQAATGAAAKATQGVGGASSSGAGPLVQKQTGALKNINFKAIAGKAAIGFAAGAAALLILTPALVALGSAILYLGNATANLIGITPEKAQEMVDNILGILSAASTIGIVVAGMSATLAGIGYLVQLKQAIPLMKKGALALLVGTPALVALGSSILMLGNAVSNIFGIDSKKAEEMSNTIYNILFATAKIGLAVAGLSALLAGLGALSALTYTIPLIAIGGAALTLMTPVLVGLAATIINLSNQIFKSFNLEPSKLVETANAISNILWSYAKIGLAVITSSTLLAGLSALAPIAHIVGISLVLGSQVLEGLTYGLILAAGAITNTANKLMNSIGISPDKISQVASDIGSIIWSMAKIATGVIAASSALAGIGLASFLPTVLFVKPLMNKGAEALGILTEGVINAAGAIFKIANSLTEKLGIDSSTAKETSENIAGIIGSMASIIRAVNIQRKNLTDISKIDVQKVAKQIGEGAIKISQIMRHVVKASMFIGKSTEQIFKEEKLSIDQSKKSVTMIDRMIKMLIKTKRFLNVLDRTLAPWMQPQGIFRTTKISSLKNNVGKFSEDFKSIATFLQEGLINPISFIPLYSLKEANSNLSELIPLLRQTSLTVRTMDNVFGALTSKEGWFDSSIIERLKISTEDFKNDFSVIVGFIKDGLINPLNELSFEFSILDKTVSKLSTLLNVIKKLPSIVSDLEVITSGEFNNKINSAVSKLNEQLSIPSINQTVGVSPKMGGSQLPITVSDRTPIIKHNNTEQQREMFGINQDTTELVKLVKKIAASLDGNGTQSQRNVSTIPGRKSVMSPDSSNMRILTKGSSRFGDQSWNYSAVNATTFGQEPSTPR